MMSLLEMALALAHMQQIVTGSSPRFPHLNNTQVVVQSARLSGSSRAVAKLLSVAIQLQKALYEHASCTTDVSAGRHS